MPELDYDSEDPGYGEPEEPNESTNYGEEEPDGGYDMEDVLYSTEAYNESRYMESYSYDDGREG